MSVKIHFNPLAERQLSLIYQLDTVNTGFVSGLQIGKHVIIENLFPAAFDEKNIDHVYCDVFKKTGEKLIGLFFKNKNIFASDWFIGDIILKIGDRKNEFFLYEETV